MGLSNEKLQELLAKTAARAAAAAETGEDLAVIIADAAKEFSPNAARIAERDTAIAAISPAILALELPKAETPYLILRSADGTVQVTVGDKCVASFEKAHKVGGGGTGAGGPKAASTVKNYTVIAGKVSLTATGNFLVDKARKGEKVQDHVLAYVPGDGHKAPAAKSFSNQDLQKTHLWRITVDGTPVERVTMHGKDGTPDAAVTKP